MNIDDYFSKNRIVKKTIADATKEQMSVDRKLPDSKYWDVYYSLDMDNLRDCLEFDNFKEFFDVILTNLKGKKKIFEPCCYSGTLGNYLALNLLNSKYLGMDINEIGIKKAKEKATLNGINPEFFVNENYWKHTEKHDAVIGINVLCDLYFNPDRKIINALTHNSNSIIMILPAHNTGFNFNFLAYKQYLDREGFSFEQLTDLKPSQACDGYLFVMKAERK